MEVSREEDRKALKITVLLLSFLFCCFISIKEGFKDLTIFVLVFNATLKQYSPKKLISFFLFCLVVEESGSF